MSADHVAAPTGGSDESAVLETLLRSRFSCRGFLGAPVPRPTIERLLTLAQRAPSWCNTQPWQVIVTEGEGTKRFRSALRSRAAEAGEDVTPDVPMPTRYEGVHLARRREVGWQLYEAVGVARGDRVGSARQTAENFVLFGAPHIAIVTSDAAQGSYGALDTGVYVGTFLLGAQSLGLGAVAQAAVAMHSAFVREYFDIPPDRAVLLGISFGYPDDAHPANTFRTRRAELTESVRWVSW